MTGSSPTIRPTGNEPRIRHRLDAGHHRPVVFHVEADHLRCGDDPARGRALPAQGPRFGVHPVVRRDPVFRGGLFQAPVAGPQTDRCASGTCSPTPPDSPTGSTTRMRPTRSTARPVSSGETPPALTWRPAVTRGLNSHSCSSRVRNGTTACRPTCSVVWSRWSRAATRCLPPRTILDPLGMDDTEFWVPEDNVTGSPSSTSPSRRRSRRRRCRRRS